MTNDFEIEKMRAALRASWSANSSSLWSATNPARGQCSVTALAVERLIGGELLKTRVGDAWHFYNRIEGKVVDFTAEQFENVPEYLDLPATRSEVLCDTSTEQLEALLWSLRRQTTGDPAFSALAGAEALPGLAPRPTRD